MAEVNTRNTMMAFGAGLEMVTGVMEAVNDLPDLFVNPASNLALDIKVNGIGEDDSLFVINAPDEQLMAFYEWSQEKYAFGGDHGPSMAYLEPKGFADFFGTKDRFCLVGRSSDANWIREDWKEFAREYYFERDIPTDERDTEVFVNEEEGNKEINGGEEEDSPVFFSDEDGFYDDSDPVKGKRKSDKAKHYRDRTGISASAGTREHATSFSERSNRAYEDEYRREREETVKTREEFSRKEAEESAKAKERVSAAKGLSREDPRHGERSSQASEVENRKPEIGHREARESGSEQEKQSGSTGMKSPGEEAERAHLERVRKEREERRNFGSDIRNANATSGAPWSNADQTGRTENGYNEYGAYFSNVKVETDPVNPDQARLQPYGQRFDGVAGSRAVSSSEGRNLRYYSTTSVINNSSFQHGIQSAGYVLSEVLIPRDAPGASATHKVINVAIPLGEIAIMAKKHAGAIALNETLNFDENIYMSALRNGGRMTNREASEEIKSMLDSIRESKGSDVITMHDVNRYLLDNDGAGLAKLVMQMKPDKYMEFLNDAGVSSTFRDALLSVKGEFLLNQDTFERLAKVATSQEDLKLLDMIKGSMLEGKYGKVSVAQIIMNSMRRATRQMTGHSEGMTGIQNTSSFGRILKTAYKQGMKIVTKIAKMRGASRETIRRLTFAQSPVKNVAKQILKKILGKGAQAAAKAASGTATGAAAGTAAAGTAGATTAGVAAGSAGAATAGAATSGAAAGASSAGAAAGGTAAGVAGGTGTVAAGVVCWIIVIIVVIIMICVTMYKQETQKKKQQEYITENSSGEYMYIQDTEILNEVITLLQQKNTAFMTEINTAAANRTGNAYNPNFDEGVDLSFYEEGGYAVVFRDFYGNLLDPHTVDLNNTKAILAMASKYIPYPFTKQPDNVSQKQKNDYEQAKQYFIDYCSYLWACTHQVSIEEYHPGDVRYSEFDNTGLSTDGEGKCDQDGATVWLPDSFIPNEVKDSNGNTTVCDQCSEKPNTGMGDYGDALCTNGKGKNEHDGWRLTGKTKTHYNCPDGHLVVVGYIHHEGEEHGSGTEEDPYWKEPDWDEPVEEVVYCGDRKSNGGVWLVNEAHKHTCYEWVYDCGSHMGSVVYVTIGDLSRIPSLPAAGDVDYTAVGQYP